MRIRSRGFQVILVIFGFFTAILAYKGHHRHREIIDFFKVPEDLTWARTYLDKKINFCDLPWEETRVLKIENAEQYLSPTGHFKVDIYTNAEHEEAFDVIDTKADKKLLTFTFNWDPKGASFGFDDLKWARNERFLIFRHPITMDSDWATSRIYVSDTTSGAVIYLGDSEFYECVLKNW